MVTGLLVFCVMLVVFFIWKMIKPRTGKNLTATANKNTPSFLYEVNNNADNEHVNTPPQEVWWKCIGVSDQLQLALLLTKKAFPVWEKFVLKNEPGYRNSSTAPIIKIDPALLQTAIDEISIYSGLQFPNISDKKIHQCNDNFVGPLIAMQDGYWPATYPVKKIFLSVYNILQSIMEQDNIPGMKNLLATSINQSLECLDVSKLYSQDEINSFLEMYRNKVQPKAF